MENINTILAVIGIITAIGSVFGAFNRIKTITAVQDEKIKNLMANLAQFELMFEKYKDRQDTKYKDVFDKIDEHYQSLDKKISELTTLIATKK